MEERVNKLYRGNGSTLFKRLTVEGGFERGLLRLTIGYNGI